MGIICRFSQIPGRAVLFVYRSMVDVVGKFVVIKTKSLWVEQWQSGNSVKEREGTSRPIFDRLKIDLLGRYQLMLFLPRCFMVSDFFYNLNAKYVGGEGNQLFNTTTT